MPPSWAPPSSREPTAFRVPSRLAFCPAVRSVDTWAAVLPWSVSSSRFASRKSALMRASGVPASVVPLAAASVLGVRFVFTAVVSAVADDHHADCVLYDALKAAAVWTVKFISTEDYPIAWQAEIAGALAAKLKELAPD